MRNLGHVPYQGLQPGEVLVEVDPTCQLRVCPPREACDGSGRRAIETYRWNSGGGTPVHCGHAFWDTPGYPLNETPTGAPTSAVAREIALCRAAVALVYGT